MKPSEAPPIGENESARMRKAFGFSRGRPAAVRTFSDQDAVHSNWAPRGYREMLTYDDNLLVAMEASVLEIGCGADESGRFDPLFGVARLNLRIAEVPIRYRKRTHGFSSIRHWKHADSGCTRSGLPPAKSNSSRKTAFRPETDFRTSVADAVSLSP
jgi:hypothetical protein